MIESTVKISMKDNNDLGCSYAIVCKDSISVIIILKASECAIFDYNELKENNSYNYLLLKHYINDSFAYKDFLKLIGKMCKKDKNSKYFLNHKDEDNRMLFYDFEHEKELNDEEKTAYEERFLQFKSFVLLNKNKF